MDDLTKTLFDLQSKTENCSKSDRIVTLNFLKKLINNLENAEKDETLEKIIKDVDSNNISKDSPKQFESAVNIKKHKSIKLTIRKFKSVDSNFKCHDCHKTFITMKKMISHVLNSHTKAEVTCRICKGTFYCYNLLIIHECLYPRQTVFIHRQCGICEKTILQKSEYHSHMKEEHMLSLEKSSKLFTCHTCHANFPLRSQLLVHSSQFHKETCSKEETSTSKFLKIPQNTINVDNDTTVNIVNKPKPVIKTRNWCTVCKRNFLSQKALNKHFLSYMHKVNSGELKMFKKFVCDECGNSFNKMICLQHHVSTHHNEFAHKCNLCDYRTSEKCNLTEHMRRHYQIRNFACEFCEARFIAKRELKDHVAFKHNTLRPFECPDCGKLFKTKRILRRHVKTHSEFRPYVCACGSNFLRMTNLRRHHLSVHHESNPTITKIQAEDDIGSGDQFRDYWYADSKFIKNKKSTPSTLKQANTKNDSVSKNDIIEPIIESENVQIMNVNYIMKVSNDNEKESKMHWNINQNFLDQSDVRETATDNSSLNCIISAKSSMQDSSVIDDSLNICDLVSSPSYPLLVSSDQPDDTSCINKISFDISIKSENISKYQVDSIMMDSENRNSLDGIWRPIDTLDHEQTSSMTSSHPLDIFPQNPGLISSFNEVFLTSVSNNGGYHDDGVQWNGLSLSNPNNFNPDNSAYIYTGTVSACEQPLCDNNMPVSDSISASSDTFLFYNQQQQQQPHISNHSAQQSFAYIESYPANVDHSYGAVNDNFSTTFCSGLNSHQQYQQNNINSNNNIQDIFSLSYSSTTNNDFQQIPPNNSSISNLLFNQDQLFHHNNPANQTTFANYTNHSQPLNSWIHGQHSPLNDFPTNDSLPPLILDSYKISSQIPLSSSSSSNNNNHHQHPMRILSPIDFFVSDNLFSSGIKHEYCLALQDMPNNGSPLISDFCTQNHQFSHNSAQFCSKNFSVVNLISTGCAAAAAATVVSKHTDDGDLLYSGPDESGL